MALTGNRTSGNERWYRKGRVARLAGRAKSACPPTAPASARTAWLAGWGYQDVAMERAVVMGAIRAGQEQGT